MPQSRAHLSKTKLYYSQTVQSHTLVLYSRAVQTGQAGGNGATQEMRSSQRPGLMSAVCRGITGPCVG